MSCIPINEPAPKAEAGSKRTRAESFAQEISDILKDLESGIMEPPPPIAAGQALCAQVNAKQDNVYQKLYEVTNELKKEKAINQIKHRNIDTLYAELQAITNELKKEKERNETIHKKYTAELKAKQNQIECQDAAISHLNAAIRAKEAQLAKVDDIHHSIHVKLDALLARGA